MFNPISYEQAVAVIAIVSRFNWPFDRHDWYVNRCGKEVRYIIDYYDMEDKDGNTEYFIDARPAPTAAGLFDRARLAFSKWRRGEKAW